MSAIFISYARSDKFFAELLDLKLREDGIAVWRDSVALNPGTVWRQSIDIGLAEAKVCIVVLSKASAASHYVTYEWATAMANDKVIIPILLEACDLHPKMEPIQFIDFQNHQEETWQRLVDRVQDAAKDFEGDGGIGPDANARQARLTTELPPDEQKAEADIQAYLHARGYRMVSLDRIRKRINTDYDDAFLNGIARHSRYLAAATLSGNRPGLKLI